MKLAIYGYGNLGKGVELAIAQNSDLSLFGVFTRRDPKAVKTLTGAPVLAAADVLRYTNDIDLLIVCGGSATDLPKMMPALAAHFNVLDSFDTHRDIPKHFAAVDKAATESGHIALISAGWDPGMFSLLRLYGEAVLPCGKSYTFWGRGVSQGHSDAIRRIDGVLDARQYTVPINAAVDAVRSGACPDLTAESSHRRECFVVAEPHADRARIEKEIKEMPAYFAGYDTTVTFITEEELQRDHAALPHGGFVIRSGRTGKNGENTHVAEYALQLDSNPEFTGSVLCAFARALCKMFERGVRGCKTVFDIAPADLSPLSPEELRAHLL